MVLAKEKRSAFFPLFAAAWWALTAGFLEAAILATKKMGKPLMKLGPDYVWMGPLALLIVFLALGLMLILAGKFWKRLDIESVAIFSYAVLAFMDLLILIPGLYQLASLALAAGISTQIVRVIRKRRDGFQRLVRGTLPLMAGLLLLLSVGVHGASLIREKRTLAALPPPPAQAANLLVITLDAVRAANTSLNGYARQTTPRIAALAERSVAFDRALSTASWTLPSHASIFTGHWYHELSADYDKPLDATYPTLAEFLSERGYRTAGFVGNLGYCGAETGLARGFAHYEDYPISWGQVAASSGLTRTVLDNFRLRRLLKNDQHLNRQTADVLNDNVLHWIDRDPAHPFFVFLNYFDAHDPYLPPPPFDSKFGPGRKNGKHSPLHHWLYNPAIGHRPLDQATIQEEIDAYDGAVAYLDDRLGLLLDGLKERGLLDNTLVVITADHGEEFGEHRVFEHSYSLYGPSVNVPLVISFPGKIPASRVGTPVSLRDLPATVTDLLGFHDAPFPGTSLRRVWDPASGARGVDISPALSELNFAPRQPEWFPISKGDMKSVVSAGMHYIRNGDGSEELYDYEGDPWERADLASDAKRQAVLEQLRGLLNRMTGK